MIDIDQNVGPGFYDVKEHFCSVAPLVMFLRFIFSMLRGGRRNSAPA